MFHTPTQQTSTPYTVNIFGVTITGGAGGAFAGGGIAHLARGANLNLTQSTVSGNSASQGGGIHNGAEPSFGGTMTINRSTISGNESEAQGGGIQNATTLNLTNTTVSGNQSNIGGGILNTQTLRITDSTIAFNTALNNSGGIYASSGATLLNTIVANNKSAFTTSNNCSDPLTSEGNNLENGTSCGFTQPGDINANPVLAKLTNNGGPTNTHALGKSSPAMDAGGTPFPSSDQRGVARPQGIANDIGSYEKEQAINVVRCPTEVNNYECIGTSASDALIGRDPTDDYIRGGEGNDVYNGKGGGDSWYDASATSSDRYLVTVKDINSIGIDFLSIQDDGGKRDILDLSRFYKSSDFVYSRGYIHLVMDGPGLNDIVINNYFTTNSIESIVFSDKTLTAKQIKAMNL